jgi:SulP family sulfate permease
LRNFCEKRGATLVYCALSPANSRTLKLGGFFGGKSRHQLFADLNLALAWCENQLLAQAKLDTDTDLASFETWLQHQLGTAVAAADFVTYLTRRDIARSQILYREGEPADNIDLLATGTLAVDIAMDNGKSLCVRRIATHAVLGEMGFFRRRARSASVSSDGPVTLFTLTRANFERMRRERPDLANAFDDFIMRTLADRIDFANREVVALSR